MVTSLRKVSTNAFTKTIAFILVVLFVAMAGFQIISIANIAEMDVSSVLFYDDYYQTPAYNNLVIGAFFAISDFGNHRENGPANVLEEWFTYYINISGNELYNSEKPVLDYSSFKHGFFFYDGYLWNQYRDNITVKTYYNSFSEQLVSAVLSGDFPVQKRNETNEEIKNPIVTAYFAFNNNFLDAKINEWNSLKEKSQYNLISMVAYLSAAFLLIVFLVAVTGRRPEDKELHLCIVDRLYTDVALGLYLIVLSLLAYPIGDFFRGNSYLHTYNLYMQIFYYIVGTGIITLTVTLTLLLFLSYVRKLKGRILLRHTLVFSILCWLYKQLKRFTNYLCLMRHTRTKALLYRMFGFILLLVIDGVFFLISMMNYNGFFAMFFLFIGAGLCILYITGNIKIYDTINKGFNESINEQMKSERMKVQLVTNVSHDLKTPLTSIISYTDLLSKEELPPAAADYVAILKEKSEKLSHIVSDLFDLAKSQTGNLPLSIETLDIKKLVEQTLADMSDRINTSTLQFKPSLPEHPVMISGDGKKLYRALQNLIDNALKYSFEGTRVYITLTASDGQAILTIKNTAVSEMNFTPSEVLSRFYRGDSSRSTEGSGLGLSIAESFVGACGGIFKVDVDGDLFKVSLIFHITLEK